MVYDMCLLFPYQPSVTTNEIDKAVHQMIIDAGAYPSPLGYGGFPKSVCTSVNECMCHGIPDSRQLQVFYIIHALFFFLKLHKVAILFFFDTSNCIKIIA